MPAHIGAFSKLKLFGAFLKVNLDPRDESKILREQRVAARNLRNQHAGTPDAGNNRTEYVPWKYVMEFAEEARSKREVHFRSYNRFREFLDKLDPARPYVEGNRYTDQTEWNLYLRPGTEFDGQCQLYLEAARGDLLAIFHRSDRSKLKRIEAVPTDGKMVILWSDAS